MRRTFAKISSLQTFSITFYLYTLFIFTISCYNQSQKYLPLFITNVMYNNSRYLKISSFQLLIDSETHTLTNRKSLKTMYISQSFRVKPVYIEIYIYIQKN